MSIPEIWIERVHLGEGTAEMAAAIDADPEAKQKLAALREADAAYHATFEADAQIAAIERKLHVANTADAVHRSSSRRGWLSAALPLLAAATALVIIAPRMFESGPLGVDALADGRTKGAQCAVDRDKVMVFQKKRSGFRSVSEGTVFPEGATLQLGYRSGCDQGVLLSLDGRGTVTVHMPYGADTSMQPGKHTLDHAYELDDAPEFERFFLVTGDEALSVEDIVAAAEALGGSGDPQRTELTVSEDLSVTDFTIRKVSP